MAEDEKKSRDGQPERSGRRVLFVQLPVACRCPDPCPGHRSRKRSCCDVAACVRTLWTGLSVLVTFCCCFAFVQPYWLADADRRSTFGLYAYCVRDAYVQLDAGANLTRRPAAGGARHVVHGGESCSPYGQYFRLAHLPSNAWQIACVLFGGGCLLQAFGALAAALTAVMADWWASRFAGYTGYIQTMGVMTCVSGLLTFPLGLDSDFVRHYCPDARMFYAGRCHVGWAFTLGIMGTALSLFCPFLSQYVTFRNADDSYV